MEIIKNKAFIHLYNNKVKLISLWLLGIFINLPFNKGLEFEIRYTEYWSWFKLFVFISRKCDHSGLNIEFGIPFVEIELNIYDCRHWNYDEDRWYLPGEEGYVQEEE